MENHSNIDTQMIAHHHKARDKRTRWESVWQDCYDYAWPQRGAMFSGHDGEGVRRGERLYDGTALDAVDQLASLLLGNITPPLTPWFGLKPGTDVSAEDAKKLAPLLEKTSRIMQAHFDQSNFIVELHQSLVDLIVAGTASLAFEESDPGEMSAFTFTAIPLSHIVMEEGVRGTLDTSYRNFSLTAAEIGARYPDFLLADSQTTAGSKTDDQVWDVTESIIPLHDKSAYLHCAFLSDSGEVLHRAKIDYQPYVNFRWMKSAGEIYGRSPVMKALPDIKTANKVVELILKNASISVTGIWQAEDDGVLNLANIELVPGAIIPKAVGSKGLTPLEMPARFDVSQIVLTDLRSRIRHALQVDRLPQMDAKPRTATEIIERGNEMSLLLGATFGRLQVELLNPLIQRAYQILRRRGAIPDLPLDGRVVAIEHRSPLARAQAGRHVEAAIGWVQAADSLGPEAAAHINRVAVLEYLTAALGLPAIFLNSITQNSIDALQVTKNTLTPTNQTE